MRALVCSAVVLAFLSTAQAEEATSYQDVVKRIADIENALDHGNCGYAGNFALQLSDEVDGLTGAIGIGLDPINRADKDTVGDLLVNDDFVRGTSVTTSLKQRRNELLVRAGECLVNGRRTKYARTAFAKALTFIDPSDADLWKRARVGLWDELGVPDAASN